MGEDFVRSLSSKPWRKGWDHGLDMLREPDLFSMRVAECDQLLSITLCEGGTTTEGAECVMHLSGQAVHVTENLRMIGTLSAPTGSLVDALKATNGIGFARVVRLGSFGDTVDIRVGQ